MVDHEAGLHGQGGQPHPRPEDFPLVDLGQTEIDGLFDRVSDVENLLPLTHMQRGMLYHSVQNSEFYLVQFTATLTGKLDIEAFRRAWDVVLGQHEILRGSVHWSELRAPTMVIQRRVALPFSVRDLRSMTAEEAEAEMAAFIVADRRIGIDVTKAPMLRFMCFQLADREYRVIWSVHNMLSDGWGSWRAVWNDVTTVYQAEIVGEQAILPPRGRWSDFLAWLVSYDPSDAEPVWRGALAGHAGPTFPLVPTPNPETGEDIDPIRESSIHSLPADQVAEIEDFSRAHHIRMDTLVNAAWALLLSRYATSNDVTYGSITSGRRTAKVPKVGRMVGMFLNTLPFHVNVTPGKSTMDFVTDLQAYLDELRGFEHVPLPTIREWAGVRAGEELFASILLVQNMAEVNQLKGTRDEVDFQVMRTKERMDYPLIAVVQPGRQRLELRFYFDERRIEADVVERMLPHLGNLFVNMVRRPDLPVQALPMDAVAGDSLPEITEAPTTQEEHACLHELVLAQAERTPDALAVRDRHRYLTYRELARRSAELAARLTSIGVGPDQLVGVYLDRTVDTVVALLAILRAGGGYLPLDPSYPAARTALMTTDSHAVAVLTRKSLRGRADKLHVPVIVIDEPGDEPPNSTVAPAGKPGPADLAYVIYTSGSNGVPKGVAVEHRNAVNLVRWAGKTFSADELSSVLAGTSLCFDLSVFEIFAPLAAGGCVVLVDSVLDLAEHAEAGIRLINTVPAVMATLLAADALPASVRTVCLAGEVLSPTLAAAIGRSGQVSRLVNLYGPSETTTYSAWQEVDPTRTDVVPIGRPIANTQLHLLDGLGRPVPTGVIGEIHIGGAGVTRGYLHRPELTLQRFGPAPSGMPAERLYRTGDLGYRLPDGAVVFVGRTDQQIKLNGYRIELGEVEQALLAHPEVTEAAVAPDRDHTCLVGYVVGSGGLSVEQLRAHLAQRLPRYLIPERMRKLDALTKSANGKLDRAALPVVGPAARPRPGNVPVSPTERTLAAIWAEVFDVPAVGVHDDFVALGGNSMVAMRVLTKARRAGLSVTSQDLFSRHTIARLAEVAQPRSPILTEQTTIVGPAPLTPAQHEVLTDAVTARGGQTLVLDVAPQVDIEMLDRALHRLIGHHDALRLRLEHGQNGWQQHYALAGAPFAVQRLDLSALAADADRLPQLREMGATIDPADGPALRAVLADFGASAGRQLFLAVHHLAVDRASWQVLVEDLAHCYGELSVGREPLLPRKTSSYRQWAEHLIEIARAPQAVDELAAWQQLLRPAPALPTDHAGPNTVASGREARACLAGAPVEALLRNGPAEAEELLYTAIALRVARQFGQSEILLGVLTDGREQAASDLDLSRTIGNFTVCRPLRLSLPAATDLDTASKALTQALGATPSGANFGALRWMSQFAAEEPALPDPQLRVRLVTGLDGAAKQDGPLTVRMPYPIERRDPAEQRTAILDVDAVLVEDRLEIVVGYSANLHTERTARDFADGIAATLREAAELTDLDGIAGG